MCNESARPHDASTGIGSPARDGLVSVVIPVYNGERYLAEAIESVLAQNYRPIEVIVVDDGSMDGSADVAQRFVPRIRYNHQPQSGTGAARNQGTELAEGDFFAFLDADDRWMEDKLARQMAPLEQDPTLDMVFGHARQFYSPELEEVLKSKVKRVREIMPGYLSSAMLIRREAFFRVGPFATNWGLGVDIDWYARATERGTKALLLPEVVLARRLHDANSGILRRDAGTDRVRVLKAALDRRRAAGQAKEKP